MIQGTSSDPEPPNCNVNELCNGGFTGDTEVVTTTGLCSIADLDTTDSVLALNPVTGIVKPKAVVDIMPLNPAEEIVSIKTRRSDFRVMPDHRIPYTTKQISNPRFVRARNLPERINYRFLNKWRSRPGTRLPQVDITDVLTDFEARAEFDWHGHTVRRRLPDGCEPCRANGHYGYFFDAETFKTYQNELEALAENVTVHAGRNHWYRPYRFDGDDFIEFLGWFITEGSVTWKEDSDSAVVQIAQETPRYRDRIATLLERMNLSVDTQDRSFSFGSVIFGRLLNRLCGTGSKDMHLPDFIWECSAEQKELLFRTLVDGDGHESIKYYTASKQLAQDIMRLQVELGMKPRYERNGDIWRLSLSTIRDGFKSSRNVSFIEVTEPMYQLTIEDFSLILAGRNRTFQWIGVSNVS